MKNCKDLTGKRFGILTVLYRAEDEVTSDGKNLARWHCRCDCGNECDVKALALQKGRKSCGCLRGKHVAKDLQDLTGQKFGKLTVLYRAEIYRTPKGAYVTRWHCKCDCGNECDVRAQALKEGTTKSCGCLPKGRHPKTLKQNAGE